jgi:hypothetical protein
LGCSSCALRLLLLVTRLLARQLQLQLGGGLLARRSRHNWPLLLSQCERQHARLQRHRQRGRARQQQRHVSEVGRAQQRARRGAAERVQREAGRDEVEQVRLNALQGSSRGG